MTNKKDTQNRIQILIAVIGLIGAVTVAVINLLGKQWEISTTNNILTPKSGIFPSPTLVLNRFDDPLKLFSVSYPSNFYVYNREIKDSDVTASIIPTGYTPVPESPNDENLALIAVVIRRSNASESVESYFNDMINNTVFNYHDTDGKRTLISNEVVGNGYKLHFRETLSDKSFVDFFIWNEFDTENKISAILMVLLTDKSIPVYGNAVDSIIESFTWNPRKANEILK